MRCMISRAAASLPLASTSGRNTVRGSAIDWPIVMRGSRLASGSWKTICNSCRSGCISLREACAIFRPSHATDPADGSSSFNTPRASVDFPQPLSPTTPTVSPGRSDRLTPSTARSGTRLPNNPPGTLTGNVTCRSSTSSIGVTSFGGGAPIDGRDPRSVRSIRGIASSNMRV